jgi:hypothetical protein
MIDFAREFSASGCAQEIVAVADLLVLTFFGGLLILVQGSAVAPVIYTVV